MTERASDYLDVSASGTNHLQPMNIVGLVIDALAGGYGGSESAAYVVRVAARNPGSELLVERFWDNATSAQVDVEMIQKDLTSLTLPEFLEQYVDEQTAKRFLRELG